jgi:energy-coupling factor transport system permease protein
MLNGLALGTYQAGASVAHRLDGRTKVLALVGATASAFGAKHLYYFLILTAVLVAATLAARLKLRTLARGMLIILGFLAISALISTFFIPAGKTQIHLGSLHLSEARVNLGVRYFFQFATLIYGAQVLTLTTAPLAIATALQRLCKPLRLIRVPVEELAMLITLSLTFLPLIREQVRTVIDAQLARGVDLRHGPWEMRLRSVLSLFNPIISANLRRAGDLAIAMEARGYRVGMTRTYLREQRFTGSDYVVMLLTVALFAGAVLV